MQNAVPFTYNSTDRTMRAYVATLLAAKPMSQAGVLADEELLGSKKCKACGGKGHVAT